MHHGAIRIIRKIVPWFTERIRAIRTIKEQWGQHTQTSGCTNYRNEYLHFDWNHRLTLSWSTIRNHLSYNRIMSKELFLCCCTAYTNLKLNPHSWCVQSSSIKIYQNASTCKERDQLINTKLRIQQLSSSCASGCGTALRIKACRVVSCRVVWIVLISGPGRAAESQVNWIYFILSAMAPYGVVFQLLFFVHDSESTQQHERTTLLTAMWHHQSR